MPFVIKAVKKTGNKIQLRTLRGREGAIRAFGTKKDAMIARKSARKVFGPAKKTKFRLKVVRV